MKSKFNHLAYTLHVLSNSVPPGVGVDFYEFWFQHLQFEYYKNCQHSLFGQTFNYYFSAYGITRTIAFDIGLCEQAISKCLVTERPFDKQIFLYHDTNTERGHRWFNGKSLTLRHAYTIMAVPIPLPESKEYLVIEGNHRISSAIANNDSLLIHCFDSYLLPPEMFLSNEFWLAYIMYSILKHAQTIYPEKMDYSSIGDFLKNYTV